jgi:glycosyltransferase involved in cell wall biosynthesis
MPFISIVSGCYNEEENVRELWQRVTRVMAESLPGYTYEFIIIDNCSTDGTADILREICRKDKCVKVILNNRNFGHIRSGYYAMLQAGGQAVIIMASDLEDPPEMIPQFVREWEAGYKTVLAQKRSSEEGPLFIAIRRLYYNIVTRLSETPLVKDATGFGLYDRRVMEDIREIGDPYPYVRGLICELGYSRCLIPFDKPARKRGITKNNFYTLYDMAMLGITNHSKVPLRLAVFAGCGIGLASFLVAFGYLVYKLLFWNNFQVGMAPLVIGIFFLGAVQLFFVGILGEYIGSIHTQVLKRPLVIEKERINFDPLQGGPDESDRGSDG